MRIISGTAKGRNIDAPPGRNTRPTGSMVREAIFGMLGSKVAGASVLDLFCGSGAMALEALSRGAAEAVLIDRDARACAVARANAQKLSLPGCSVYRNDYIKAMEILARRSKRFHIVFIDPPYAEQEYYQKSLKGLSQHDLLHPEAVVVCEHDKKDEISAAGFVLIKRADYGSKSVSLITEENQ